MSQGPEFFDSPSVKEVLKCVNCADANRKFNLKLETAHNALDRECPAYQRALKRKAKSIDYFE
jgi:hypothetical protein